MASRRFDPSSLLVGAFFVTVAILYLSGAPGWLLVAVPIGLVVCVIVRIAFRGRRRDL